MSLLSTFTREIGWQVKSHLRYSPKLKRKKCIKDPGKLLATFDAAQLQRLNELQERYSTEDWPALCSQPEFIENLYVLDILDQYLDHDIKNGLGLDIGCRNFSHLPALSAFTATPWHGVELDAYGRYYNGYTRLSYGQWMSNARKDCRYLPGSLLQLSGNYQMIVWILPFITPAPLRLWGLPDRYFEPEALLAKAWSLLGEKGEMLIINQGEREADIQQTLFSELGITALPLGKIDSLFSPFNKSRFGWRVSKTA